MREMPFTPAHAGGFLPDTKDRRGRRQARKRWQAAADQLVRDQRDQAAVRKTAEKSARKAEYRSRTPKAGEKRPWAASTTQALRLRKHRATTANLSHVYPFLADGGLGASGIDVGRDSYSGASFCYCGFDLYNRRPRLVSNTNIMIVGNIGWGKSNTAMALAVRNLVFGRRVVVDALVRHRDRTATSSSAAPGSAFVFGTRHGTPLEPRNLTRKWTKLAEREGIRRVNLHGLRHACVSLLLSLGVNPRTVMEIVGHSALEMTMNVYGHVNLDTQRRALDELDQSLR